MNADELYFNYCKLSSIEKLKFHLFLIKKEELNLTWRINNMEKLKKKNNPFLDEIPECFINREDEE